MAAIHIEAAQLAGRIAGVEVANRTRNAKGQQETLIAVASGLVGLLEGRDGATVGLAVTSFAKGLIEAAERGAK